jgi:malate dehydrogenase (oxaloacetate-decarboxylating)
MGLAEEALALHERSRGKIEVNSKVPLKERRDLTLAYTPGVAEPCRKIHENPDLAYKYTSKWNLVAVVSDGTAVLGLGDIGPEAAMPVMEGKALLFKEFGGVDAFPLCIRTKDVGEIVDFVKKVEPTFGGINLEDISAPRCFEVEERLKKELSIPVFHDDQHGTAVVVLAALSNALKVVGKELGSVRIVISGAGAAATATGNFLLEAGAGDVILCDTKGPIYAGRTVNMNSYKEDFAKRSNKKKVSGTLADALKGADAFIGLSAPGLVTKEMVASMAPKAVVFAMANPTPEIMPDLAKEAGAAIIGTGRSDFPNQINNVLAFPGIFRGALDVRAGSISEGMKLAASNAIAAMVTADKLSADYIIPPALDREVAKQVAKAVAEQAKKEGLARPWP